MRFHDSQPIAGLPRKGQGTKDEGQRTNDKGPGFTLIELLVVMTIIAILMGLLLGALRAAYVSRQKNETQTTVRKLNARLQQRWQEVVQSARDECRNNSLPDFLTDAQKTNILTLASTTGTNHYDRAKVIWTKLRLKQQFPRNYYVALNPNYPSAAGYYLPADKSYVKYLDNYGATYGGTVTGGPAYGTLACDEQMGACLYMALAIGGKRAELDRPAAPKLFTVAHASGSLFPDGAVAHASGSLFPDPSFPGSAFPSFPGSAWERTLRGAASRRRGPLPLVPAASAQVGKAPPGFDSELVNANEVLATTTDAFALPMIIDAWAYPLGFYRWPTGNTAVDAINTSNATFRDPQDPDGKLWNTTWQAQVNGASTNGAIFASLCHAIVNQYLTPVIVSAGPDGKIGISDGVMTSDGTGDSNDNINSYDLR